MYLRQDQLIDEARTQLAHLIGTDPNDISTAALAVQLRGRGITIVCTPVSITLDTGVAEPEPDPDEPGSNEPGPADDHDGDGSQLVLPGLAIPRPRLSTKNPHRSHPLNVNDFGGG